MQFGLKVYIFSSVYKSLEPFAFTIRQFSCVTSIVMWCKSSKTQQINYITISFLVMKCFHFRYGSSVGNVVCYLGNEGMTDKIKVVLVSNTVFSACAKN